MDRRKATAKLFEMVQRGQTDNILKFLERGANINARDKDGATPLIIAAKNRNYVLQSLLLREGADVRKVDKAGRSALHHESWAGDLECVNMLLAYGAKVDAKDSNGRTPLMFAVNSEHFKVADILVFCGADGTIKDKEGKSPASICRSASLKALMKESKQIVEGIKNGLVKIQQKMLLPNTGSPETEIDLPEVGLRLRVATSALGRGVGLLLRRVPPELSRASLAPGDKELLLSDTFEYRLAVGMLEGGADVTFPVFGEPNITEAAFLKTDLLPRVDETIVDPVRDFTVTNQGDIYTEEVSCTTHIDLVSVTAFLMVTQIRVEHFPMTSKGGMVTSEIDEAVQINVPANCFGDKGDITLEILPRPLIKPGEFPSLKAISNFHDVKHSEKEQPREGRHVALRLPLPRTYTGGGKLLALLRRSTENEDDEDDDCVDEAEALAREVELWEVVEEEPTRDRRTSTFDVSHFSKCVIAEVSRHTDLEESTRTVAEVHIKARRRERQVTFGAFLRKFKDTDTEDKEKNLDEFDVVVACSELSQVHKTDDFFCTEGYKILQQSDPSQHERTVVPRQCFKVEPKGGNLMKTDNIVRLMEFHPKRKDNDVKMTLGLKDLEKTLVGWLEVDKGQKKARGKEQAKEQPKSSVEFKQVELEVNLEKEFVQDDNRFMNDKFLEWLSEEVRKDWKKFGRNLGLSDATMDRADDKIKSVAVLRVLRLWRRKCEAREDTGLPGMLSALGNTGKTDLQKEVVQRLKKWLKDAEDSDFKKWAEKESTPPNFAAEEVGETMSDDYLSWVASRLTSGLPPGSKLQQLSLQDLAGDLDVPLPQTDYIQQDPFSQGRPWQMLKLLKMSRDRCDSRVEAFEKLMQVLEKPGLQDLRTEAIQKAHFWCSSVGEDTNSEFVHRLRSLLEESRFELPTPRDSEEKQHPGSRRSFQSSSQGSFTKSKKAPDEDGASQEAERRPAPGGRKETSSRRSSETSSQSSLDADRQEEKGDTQSTPSSSDGPRSGSARKSSSPSSSSFDKTARDSEEEKGKDDNRGGSGSEGDRRSHSSSETSSKSSREGHTKSRGYSGDEGKQEDAPSGTVPRTEASSRSSHTSSSVSSKGGPEKSSPRAAEREEEDGISAWGSSSYRSGGTEFSSASTAGSGSQDAGDEAIRDRPGSLESQTASELGSRGSRRDGEQSWSTTPEASEEETLEQLSTYSLDTTPSASASNETRGETQSDSPDYKGGSDNKSGVSKEEETSGSAESREDKSRASQKSPLRQDSASNETREEAPSKRPDYSGESDSKTVFSKEEETNGSVGREEEKSRASQNSPLRQDSAATTEAVEQRSGDDKNTEASYHRKEVDDNSDLAE